jgi:hypothetical protein
MAAAARYDLPPAPKPALCCTTCGSPDYVAVKPGHDPDPHDTVVDLHPAPAVPTEVFCAAHWRWWRGDLPVLECSHA